MTDRTHAPVIALLAALLPLLLARPGLGQDREPDHFVVDLPGTVLNYIPGKATPDINFGNLVLDYGSAWEVREIHPWLFQMRQQSWGGRFFWEVNTARQSLMMVRNGTFGELGGDDERLAVRVDPFGDPSDPDRFQLRFNDVFLIYMPESRTTEIFAGEAGPLSMGEEWEAHQLKPFLFHLKNRNWDDRFWKVNTSREEIYEVTGAEVSQLGGSTETLGYRVEAFGTGEDDAAETEGRLAKIVEAARANLPGIDVPGAVTGDFTVTPNEGAGAATGEESAAPVRAFTGRWETDLGTMSLHQAGGYVMGDYGDGVLLGKVSGECAAGILTRGPNTPRTAIFRITKDGSGSFGGYWGWFGQMPTAEWSGTRERERSPASFSRFSRSGASTRLAPGRDRTSADGTYRTGRGSLELVARDGFLIGDFADAGILVGMWDGDSYVGRFTQWSDVGWFDLPFDPGDGEFGRGSWGFLGGSGGGQWAPSRSASATPEPDNMLGQVSCSG